MMDVEILSTLGFSEDDVKAIEDVKGVQDVMSGYRQDVSVTINDSDETVARFHSLPEDGAPQLNTPVLVEGRMPEKKKAGECVIGTGSTLPVRRRRWGTNCSWLPKRTMATKRIPGCRPIPIPLWGSWKLHTTCRFPGDQLHWQRAGGPVCLRAARRIHRGLLYRFASDSGWRPGYGCFFGRI